MKNDEQANEVDTENRDTTGRADEPKVCANCGVQIDTTEWHPIVTETDGDDFHVYAFCDEDCQDEWTT